MVTKAKPRFPLGQVVATPGALEALKAAGQDPLEFIVQHHVGNWGTVGPDDWQANEDSLRDGSRILSAYELKSGERLWIITEAVDDNGRRAATTLLLPEEY